ncbi:hypothetical protein HZA76_03650 [Candidatus Roizmanbacteria bacterium]|nr:hypothetical protein [Candidatus Roizmanbacteria bacterium]
MVETGNFGSWRERKRAELVTTKFIDLRSSILTDPRDIFVDKESAIQIKRQIANKEIKWIVYYHGVVLPGDNINDDGGKGKSENCVDGSYTNYFVFKAKDLVDWYVLSPNYQYFSP